MTIKHKYSTLTVTEKKVADFILQNSEAVIYMSIDDFSLKSGTVKSAVIRCCKSLGFSGYSEMKISLASEVSKNKQLGFVPYIAPNDSPGDILDKIFSANVKTLHDTAEKIDRTELKKAVDFIDGASTIYIYAIGTSAGIANDFCYRLMQLGKIAICITDPTFMKVSSLNITSDDLAIGISHSGRTVATTDAISLAKQSGAKTLCITSGIGSEITKICDCILEIFSDEIQYPMEAVSARIAHMSVIDSISIALSSRNYDDAAIRSKKSHELINTIRYKETKK